MGAATCILKSVENDRTVANILSEMSDRAVRQIMCDFDEEQKMAVAWEGMHLDVGSCTEHMGATWNFSWCDAMPWEQSVSPRSDDGSLPSCAGEDIFDHLSDKAESDAWSDDAS